MLARLAGAADDAARREQARELVARWNAELAAGAMPLWSPSIRGALVAGTPWLEVLCPACSTIGAVDLRRLDRHPEGAVAALVLGLHCSRCGPHAPMPRLLGLHALPQTGRPGAALPEPPPGP
ncbi:hypothetical protein [Rhodoplanes sp. SY1]|uniref:hypothetical protein n=1 Tax=Rhodoplanes sp. SY1 TaxID=3166646 RepID=UPI0038B46385